MLLGTALPIAELPKKSRWISKGTCSCAPAAVSSCASGSVAASCSKARAAAACAAHLASSLRRKRALRSQAVPGCGVTLAARASRAEARMARWVARRFLLIAAMRALGRCNWWQPSSDVIDASLGSGGGRGDGGGAQEGGATNPFGLTDRISQQPSACGPIFFHEGLLEVVRPVSRLA